MNKQSHLGLSSVILDKGCKKKLPHSTSLLFCDLYVISTNHEVLNEETFYKKRSHILEFEFFFCKAIVSI